MTAPYGALHAGADPLVCTHDRDFPVAVLRVSGSLGVATAPTLRNAVVKALADQPELLLIAVDGVVVVDDVTLALFPALGSHADQAGVAMMLFGASPTLTEQFKRLGIGRRMPVFRSRHEALAAFARRPGPRRVEVALAPLPTSTAAARALVDRSCARWRLGHLADTAALLATELVANAIEHAGTQLRLSLALRQRHLHIAVRDRSPAIPRRRSADDEQESGRGLLIVEALAAAWGYVETTGGKVVWATLRTGAGR